MTPDTLSTIKTILDLGWPAVVTLGFIYLAQRYLKDMADQIAYLRKRIDELEARTDKIENIRME